MCIFLRCNVKHTDETSPGDLAEKDRVDRLFLVVYGNPPLTTEGKSTQVHCPLEDNNKERVMPDTLDFKARGNQFYFVLRYLSSFSVAAKSPTAMSTGSQLWRTAAS